MHQIYRSTSITMKAEKDIIRYIMTRPLPFEIKIGARLFNILLKEVPKEDLARCVKNGIPYNYKVGDTLVKYNLVSK